MAERDHTWVEKKAAADAAADALGEEDLVILSGDGGHHEAEDVQEGP